MVSLIKPLSIKGCNTVVMAYEWDRAMCSITSARVRLYSPALALLQQDIVGSSQYAALRT